ncbi:class I SAM-dependent methyltransferase [Paraliomyxa miuraensis]|uniref:class I SAM-dependent methyltransferase n=1 Tax=Paraliomyxa miuraensis TaxID=376150 RepID=UPI00224E4627|nr:class I SAM-dependent methyltransferase [Paraliomyxa miuraensis]MCX4246489.1 class I SAM-dependent methyltransferase [Paraliomyxa miuraensis]
MTRHVRLRELLIGVEGLALLRRLYDGTDDEAEQRIGEVRRILDDEAFARGEATGEADARAGYERWSSSYDEPGNPLIAIEQPVVWRLLESIEPGYALDLACGTGRHAGRLVELGHRVVGVDLTPQMLRKAQLNVPQASFLEGDLRAIPLPGGELDLVVCGLALAHVADLHGAMAELARVVRPGGIAILSVLHPFLAHLGWHAPFEDEHGRRRFVREHAHDHAAYLDAFRRAGLRVRDCVEPRLGVEQLRAKRRAFRHAPEATIAAYDGLPGALVWSVERGG